jgi:hypothetical protein
VRVAKAPDPAFEQTVKQISPDRQTSAFRKVANDSTNSRLWPGDDWGAANQPNRLNRYTSVSSEISNAPSTSIPR